MRRSFMRGGKTTRLNRITDERWRRQDLIRTWLGKISCPGCKKNTLQCSKTPSAEEMVPMKQQIDSGESAPPELLVLCYCQSCGWQGDIAKTLRPPEAVTKTKP